MSTDASNPAVSAATDTIYQCPQSGAALHLRDGMLVSEDGSVTYELRNGIPRFLSHSVPEPEKTQDELNRLIEQVHQKPWREAIQDVYGDWDYVFPDGRDKWIELLTIEPEDVVLEIGPGLGQFSPIISGMCREFHAIEVVPEQAEFASERCRQEGRENVHFAAGGDGCRLPFKDNSFDWVVMNLVLEWCAMRNSSGDDFSAGQQSMLAEINRVLKPGGRAYLLTKNRFALRLMLGKHDEHCYGMRFGNALPRMLMSIGLRRKGKDQPRGLLHSHNTLAKMIKSAGFSKVDSFWATPEMRYPDACVPNVASEIRKARKQPGFIQGEYRSTKMIMRWIPAGLVKHFTPGLQMIAKK